MKCKFTMFLALLLLLVSSCKDFWHPEGPDKGNENGNPFKGTWIGLTTSWTVVFDDVTYDLYAPGAGPPRSSGNYTYSGNSAILTDIQTWGEPNDPKGTADAVISNGILTMTTTDGNNAYGINGTYQKP